MKTIEQVLNRVAAAIDHELIESLRDILSSQLNEQRYYRVAFPMLVQPNGQPAMCICLVARTDDERLRRILQKNHIVLKASPPSTHVFLFYGYVQEAEWRRQAKGLVRLFPEQPDAPEVAID